jgi:hypothetical protein
LKPCRRSFGILRHTTPLVVGNGHVIAGLQVQRSLTFTVQERDLTSELPCSAAREYHLNAFCSFFGCPNPLA